MKKEEIRMITIIVIAGLAIIGGLLILKNSIKKSHEQQYQNEVVEKYVDILEDGTKLNKSNKLKEIKKIDGLEIGNIQLTYQEGRAIILGDVKNTTSKDIELTIIELTLYDDNNNVIDKIEGFISPVKAGEIVQLNMGVSKDYANAYDFTVIKK